MLKMPLWARLVEWARTTRCAECSVVLDDGVDDAYCSDECYEAHEDARVI